MLVRAASVVKMPCVGTWRFPVIKRIRAGSLEIFEKVATELNDKVTIPRFTRHNRAAGELTAATHHLPQLRITAGNDASHAGSTDSSDDEDD